MLVTADMRSATAIHVLERLFTASRRSESMFWVLERLVTAGRGSTTAIWVFGRLVKAGRSLSTAVHGMVSSYKISYYYSAFFAALPHMYMHTEEYTTYLTCASPSLGPDDEYTCSGNSCCILALRYSWWFWVYHLLRWKQTVHQPQRCTGSIWL